MNEFWQTVGSFSTIWLLTWLLCSLCLIVVYPLLREIILKWQPALACKALNLLFALPFLLSLGASCLLFLPEHAGLVDLHCHDECVAHSPLISSPQLAIVGLLLMSLLLCTLLGKLINQLMQSRRLRNRLLAVSESCEGAWVLQTDTPVVFTVGLLNNSIFLTQGLKARCEARDLDIVLAHEQAHCRRRDNFRLLTVRLLLLVLPRRLSRQCYEDFHLTVESACDFAAAEEFGTTEVAEALLKIQRLSPGPGQWRSPLLASAFTGAEVESRIHALLSGRPATPGQRLMLRALPLMTAIVCLAVVGPLHHAIETLMG